MFPSNGVMIRRPLSSTGSLGMVPPLRRYYGTLRLPAALLAALSCLRGAIPPLHPIFVPHGRGRAAGARGLSVPVPQPEVAVEAAGSLRFLENPGGHCPCSPTPVGSIAPCGAKCDATDVAPAHVHGEDSGRLSFSGLNHTAFDLAVYASQDRSPGPTQDSLLAAGPALPGGIGTRRVPMKGFQV